MKRFTLIGAALAAVLLLTAVNIAPAEAQLLRGKRNNQVNVNIGGGGVVSPGAAFFPGHGVAHLPRRGFFRPRAFFAAYPVVASAQVLQAAQMFQAPPVVYSQPQIVQEQQQLLTTRTYQQQSLQTFDARSYGVPQQATADVCTTPGAAFFAPQAYIPAHGIGHHHHGIPGKLFR